MEHENTKKLKTEKDDEYLYISRPNTSFFFSNTLMLINSIFFSK